MALNKIELIKSIKNENSKNKNSRLISIWGLVSFGFCFFIRAVIRPRQYHFTGILDFLQGTLPNFFAATGICAIAFLNYKLFFGTVEQIPSTNKKLVFGFLFSFIGLTLWEIIQYFMGYPIDYYDIIMTALGSIFTVMLNKLIFKYGL